MHIAGVTALVTGANRGIGLALAHALLARGAAKVYAAARAPGALGSLGPRVVPLALDITDPAAIERAAGAAGDVCLLINNAGILAQESFMTGSVELAERDMRTNYVGTLRMIRAFAPIIERAGGGAIANVLSVVAVAGMPGIGGYSASKAAALSLTQSVRSELRPRGIAVHAVFPGPVDTDMAREFTLDKASPEHVAGKIIEGIEAGHEDIWSDPFAEQVGALWARDPKGVERQFGG